MKEKISIIIPVYNSEKTLQRCIESLINQTYKNIEILLIDDSSDDQSLEICYEYQKKDKRINVFINKNKGVSNARNLGIEYAKGEYITFVDSDDWLDVDAVETISQKIVSENIDVLRYGYYIEKNGKIKKNKEKSDYSTKYEIISDILSGRLRAYVWLLLLKKEILINNKLRFNTNISLMEDTLFYLDLLELDIKFSCCKDEKYHYCLNNSSITHDKSRYLKNIEDILKVNKLITCKLNTEQKKLINTCDLNFIMNYLFLIFRHKTVEKDEYIKILYNILNDNEFDTMLKYYKVDRQKIHYKLQYYILCRKNIILLVQFYKVRVMMSKIKDIIR